MDNNYPIINSKVNNSIKDLSGNNEVPVSKIIDNEVEVKDDNFKYNKTEESNEKKRKQSKEMNTNNNMYCALTTCQLPF